jgi:hypothetical protein
MPRNAAGVYTLPPTNPVVPFTTITTSWANPTMSDIAQALTDSLDRSGRGGMTAPFKIFDGTLSAPGISFLNEPNTGMWRSGAGIMNLSVGGVNAIVATQTSVSIPTLATTTLDLRYLQLSGGALTGALGIGGAPQAPLFVTGAGSTSSSFDQDDPLNTALYLRDSAGAPGNGGQIVFGALQGRFAGIKAGLTNGAGPEGVLYLQTSGSDGIAKPRLTVGFDSVTIEATTRINATSTGAPTYGILYFGNAYDNYVQFDGTNWNWTGDNTKTIYGNVTVAKGLTYLTAQPVPKVTTINGTYNADWSTGMSQRLSMTGPTTVTFSSIPDGSILRLAVSNTQQGLTISGVTWPLGVAPIFTAGANKVAIVVIQNIGNTIYAGNASMY